jgi:hypothetical protein
MEGFAVLETHFLHSSKGISRKTERGAMILDFKVRAAPFALRS